MSVQWAGTRTGRCEKDHSDEHDEPPAPAHSSQGTCQGYPTAVCSLTHSSRGGKSHSSYQDLITGPSNGKQKGLHPGLETLLGERCKHVRAQLQQAEVALCERLVRSIELLAASHRLHDEDTTLQGCSERRNPCQPCAIFTTPCTPTWSHFRRHATIVPSAVLKGGLRDVEGYREEEARRLGCRAADVCWWLRSECFPEITRDGEISSHGGNLACTVKLHLLFLASIVWCTAKMSQLRRLEAHRDALLDITASVTSLPPAIQLPPAEKALHPPQQFTSHALASSSTSAASGATDSAEQEPQLEATLPVASAGAGSLSVIGIHGSAEPAGSVPAAPAAPAALARFRASSAALFDRMCADFATQLHPADSLALLRHCLQIYSASTALAAATPPPEKLTALMGIAATRGAAAESMRAAEQAIRRQPCAPALPLTQEGVGAAIRACMEDMRAAQVEWTVVSAAATLDMPHMMYPVRSATSPACLGYVQFEEINVKAYKAMAFTRDQKEALVRRWREYQRQARRPPRPPLPPLHPPRRRLTV